MVADKKTTSGSQESPKVDLSIRIHIILLKIVDLFDCLMNDLGIAEKSMIKLH